MTSKYFWLKLLLPSFILLAGIGLIAGFLIFQNFLLAIVMGIVLWALIVSLWLMMTNSIIARLAKVGPTHPKKDARLIVKVENLCLQHGFSPPRLKIIKTRSLNAIAYGLSRKNATLAITLGALKTLEPVELEAVLAHELSRIRSGITGRETYGVMLLKLPFGNLFRNLYASLLNPDLIMKVDRESMKLTRYPQGLLSVLDKMLNEKHEPDSNIVEFMGISRYQQERLPTLSEFWNINV